MEAKAHNIFFSLWISVRKELQQDANNVLLPSFLRFAWMIYQPSAHVQELRCCIIINMNRTYGAFRILMAYLHRMPSEHTDPTAEI